jgi:uncharacterized protein with PQ loop repeat
MLVCTPLSAVGYEICAVALSLTPVVIMNGIFLMLAAVLLAMKMKGRFDRGS